MPRARRQPCLIPRQLLMELQLRVNCHHYSFYSKDSVPHPGLGAKFTSQSSPKRKTYYKRQRVPETSTSWYQTSAGGQVTSLVTPRAARWGHLMEISSFHVEHVGCSRDQHRHVGLSRPRKRHRSAAGLRWPFPQPPAPGEAALGRAVLSHPHLNCFGALGGAKSPVVACIAFVHSEM